METIIKKKKKKKNFFQCGFPQSLVLCQDLRENKCFRQDNSMKLQDGVGIWGFQRAITHLEMFSARLTSSYLVLSNTSSVFKCCSQIRNCMVLWSLVFSIVGLLFFFQDDNWHATFLDESKRWKKLYMNCLIFLEVRWQPTMQFILFYFCSRQVLSLDVFELQHSESTKKQFSVLSQKKKKKRKKKQTVSAFSIVPFNCSFMNTPINTTNTI